MISNGRRWQRAGARFAPVVVLALAMATSVANADPLTIRFSGTITAVDDPLHVFADIPLPAGPIDGVYTIDPAAGTLAFGDGTVGQRLPEGSASVEGTYRYGGGNGANTPPAVILFSHCFVGTVLDFRCIPANGSDAYVLELPSIASDGFVQSFVFALVGGTDVVDDEAPALLPPPIAPLGSAAFAWRFARGDRVAVATGVIESIATVPEPAAGWLVLIATMPWAVLSGIRSSGARQRSWPESQRPEIPHCAFAARAGQAVARHGPVTGATTTGERT